MRDTAEGPRIDPGEVMVQRVAAIVLEEMAKRFDMLEKQNAERSAALVAEMRQIIRFAQPIYFDRETLVHTNDHHRVILDSRERGVFCHIVENGEWEGHIRKVLRQILQPGMTVIDVGANIGLHTLVAAQKVGRTGRVHAIEPDPITADLLRRNLAVNNLYPSVTIHEAACVEAGGQEVSFHRLAEEPMMSGLAIPAWKNIQVAPTVITVPTVALGDLTDGPADLVKIDAEGAEGRIIRGMGEAVGIDTVCILELLWLLIEDVSGPGSFVGIMEFFAGRGFEMLRLKHDGTKEHVTTDWTAEIQRQPGDFAFVHPEGRHAGAFGI